MRNFTTDGLLASIRRRASLPDDESNFGDEPLILLADGELQTRIAPMIHNLTADHFLTFKDYITTTEVRYPIPFDALANNLSSVVYVDENGNESRLVRIELDDENVPDYVARQHFQNGGAYHVRGDSIVLFPSSEAAKTLRMYYHRLPNLLVSTANAARILSVDTGTGVITTASVPAVWSTSDRFCCVKGRPGFRLRFDAEIASDVSSPTITFSPSAVSDIVAGDYIALEGESPIPQIPAEAHAMLAQATVCAALEGLEDPGLERSERKLEQLMKMYTLAATPRVEADPQIARSNQSLRTQRHGW